MKSEDEADPSGQSKTENQALVTTQALLDQAMPERRIISKFSDL